MRRVFFCFIAFYLIPLTIVKIQFLMFSNLLIVIYQASYEPFITRLKNNMELFNEVCITIITFHICCYSDFMPSEESKVLMGWSMIAFSVVNTILNFGLVLKAGFGSLRLVIVKWYRRFRRLLDPEFMREKT